MADGAHQGFINHVITNVANQVAVDFDEIDG